MKERGGEDAEEKNPHSHNLQTKFGCTVTNKCSCTWSYTVYKCFLHTCTVDTVRSGSKYLFRMWGCILDVLVLYIWNVVNLSRCPNYCLCFPLFVFSFCHGTVNNFQITPPHILLLLNFSFVTNDPSLTLFQAQLLPFSLSRLYGETALGPTALPLVTLELVCQDRKTTCLWRILW